MGFSPRGGVRSIPSLKGYYGSTFPTHPSNFFLKLNETKVTSNRKEALLGTHGRRDRIKGYCKYPSPSPSPTPPPPREKKLNILLIIFQRKMSRYFFWRVLLRRTFSWRLFTQTFRIVESNSCAISVSDPFLDGVLRGNCIKFSYCMI